jgi:hypothetical protein
VSDCSAVDQALNIINQRRDLDMVWIEDAAGEVLITHREILQWRGT